MSQREQYDEAKRVLKEINHELTTRSLTPEQRSELELHAARLAGVLSHPWLPMSWTRRLIMAAIFIFGVQQAWVGNYQAMVWWILLPLFSPRIVGECSYFMGVLSRHFRA
jgi:hypothetical protein